MATRWMKAVSGEMEPQIVVSKLANKFSFTMPAAISVLVFRRGTVSRLGAVRFTGKLANPTFPALCRQSSRLWHTFLHLLPANDSSGSRNGLLEILTRRKHHNPSLLRHGAASALAKWPASALAKCRRARSRNDRRAPAGAASASAKLTADSPIAGRTTSPTNCSSSAVSPKSSQQPPSAA